MLLALAGVAAAGPGPRWAGPVSPIPRHQGWKSASFLYTARVRSGTAILALTVAAACSGGDDVRGSIKSDVRELVAERTGAKVESVTCPEDVELEAGTRFSCAAILEGGATIPVGVEMTGKRAYELDRSALYRWKVETQGMATMRAEWPALDPRDVRCPPEAAPGATLRCKVVILQGTETDVTVHIDAEGRIAYAPPDGVLLLGPLEQAIVDKLGPERGPTADCGGDIKYAPPNASFRCAVRYADGDETHAVVTVRDWVGNVAWVVHGG